MKLRWVAPVVLAACSFKAPTSAPDDGPPSDGEVDAPIDAPPPISEVRITAVEAPTLTAMRPGVYGFEVAVTIQNDLPTEITDLRVSLAFTEGATDRSGAFRWRDRDQREGDNAEAPTTIAANDSEVFRFIVDARASATGTISIHGTATFDASGTAASATPLDPPLTPPVAVPTTLTVDTTADDNDPTTTSLRDALQAATAGGATYRIVFDPGVFNATAGPIVIDPSRGELPAITQDVVIDGTGSTVVLAADSNSEGNQRYGLRQNNGTLVVQGLTFLDMGHQYPVEDVSQNNCGSNTQRDGGAIRVDNGTLVLDTNKLADTNVNERNCFAASVRLEGGTGHRLLGNTWTDQSMDAIFVDATTREIADNLMNAGGDLGKVDECIFINSRGAGQLWIVGNICVDQEFSAVIVPDSGGNTPIFVMHNTFVRNGRSSLSAVRGNASNNRRLVLRNNAYLGNNPAGIEPSDNADSFTISHESVEGSPLCSNNCPNATIDAPTLTTTPLMFANGTGSTRADFTPQAGSPLLDSGTPFLDRNGSAPRRYHGTGVERGAVEVP